MIFLYGNEVHYLYTFTITITMSILKIHAILYGRFELHLFLLNQLYICIRIVDIYK